MIPGLLALFGLPRLAASPYAKAIVVTVAAIALVITAVGWLKVHDYILTREATAACEAKERADRLETEKRALLEAQTVAQRTLKERGDAIRTQGTVIEALETQLKEARDAAVDAQDACRVVFGSDDAWLRRKRPQGPGRGRSDTGQVPAAR